MPLVEDKMIDKLLSEVNCSSNKISQEIYVKRRAVILEKIKELTGEDLNDVIPIVKKGRPKKH